MLMCNAFFDEPSATTKWNQSKLLIILRKVNFECISKISLLTVIIGNESIFLFFISIW